MKLETIMDYDKKYYMNTFGERTKVCFEYGKGIDLYDTTGQKYCDFFAGIAVSVLGHSHPALVNAIKSQAEKFIHCSSLYYIESQSKLAKLLVENTFAEKIFFSNSGAEANEGAVKLAKLYGKKKGLMNKFEIITLDNSFHGRTIMTLTATGQDKYKKQYTPLTPGFSCVPANNIELLKKAITDNTCAIMLELVQGEGGLIPLDKEYILNVKKLCDEKDILLIVDEVQTGVGRTGKFLCCENYNIEPDILTLAKALGGGVPIGAVLAGKKTANIFEPGDHGSTFGGNPLVCSASLAVINEILNENLCDNAKNLGEFFKAELEKLQEKYPKIISEVRGIGLMIGLELKDEIAGDIRTKLFDKYWLVGTAGKKVLRFLPPLIITQEDISKFITVLDETISEY